MKKLLLAFLLSLCCVAIHSADGDIFTAQTIEGVDVKFKVISESEKTCQVGLGIWNQPAISTSYVGSVTIPNSVNGYSVIFIGMSAFYDCSSLTSVTIPNSVTSIGGFAFQYCTALISVIIPDSVKDIDNYAFDGCSSLTSVTIGSSLTNIGMCAFRDCTGLTSFILPNSVTSVGTYAFFCCTNLTSVTIPNSLTSIGSFAFSGCSSLTAVYITDLRAWYDISFSNSSSNPLSLAHHLHLNGNEVKNLIIPNNVTCIRDYTFSGCSGFTGSFTIPNSVTSIGNYAFDGCSGFTGSLTIPNSVTSIGNYAFDGCSGFTGSLTIPNSVTSIGNYAFSGCKGFTGTLTLSNSVASIGDYAFSGCNGFTGSLTIPNSVTSIGDYAFSGCKGFTGSLTIPNSVTSIGISAFYFCKGFSGTLTLSNSITSIGSYAFYGCNGFTGSLTIPNSVTSIGDYAFEGCKGFTGSLTIPNSVTSIGISAFNGCKGFSGTLTLSNSITSIGRYAFDGCNGFTGSLTIPNSVTSIGDYAFEGCNGFTGSLTIPNSITSIGEAAFRNCSGFDGSLTIPNSVTSIRESAFQTCSNIKLVISEILLPFDIRTDVFNGIYTNATLQIPNGTRSKYEEFTGWTINFKKIIEEGEVVTINNITYNLNHNEKTAEVTSGTNGYSGKVVIPATINSNGTTYSVTSIGSSAFSGCSGLTAVTIPNSVTSIGNFAFKYCDGLTSIDIPNSVTSIGEGAFQNCSALTSVTIPNSVTSIGEGAFYGCSALTSVTIPNSVTSIKEYTFANCSGLTSVTISNNVKSIRELAFYGCSGLTEVHISDLAAWCNISFYDSSSNPLRYAHHLFLNGTEVKDLEVPNSITRIGNYAFSYCSSLTSVTIPNNINTIGYYAFYGCSGLSSVNITNSVTTIDGYAFYGCSGLASITIPVSVTSIGNNAFQYCSNMNFVKSEIISPFAIAENVFDRIPSGATLQIPKGTKSKYQEFIGWTLNFKNIIEEEATALTVDGVNYSVISQTEKTVKVAIGNYGQVLTVPATVTQNGKTWTVTGIDNNALKDNKQLAAVIWNPEAAFTATVSNPNLLLYVKQEQYAPAAIKNVVVNGTANSITLTEAASGNNFYCPQAFTARSISYTHRYSMTTGIGESRGWETLALPFDVQSISHETKGDITPFANRKSSDANKPFWLYELTGSGFVEAASLKAYTPYIISMPNNPQYDSQWLLSGSVTFAASNVTVGKTKDVNTATYRDRTFVPNFVDRGAAEGLYALNVNNDYTTNESGMTEGSKFVLNMRTIHPFEAYMTTASNARQVIDVFEDMTTDIRMLGIWEQCSSDSDSLYDLQGRKVSHATKGVYVNKKGQKIMKVIGE